MERSSSHWPREVVEAAEDPSRRFGPEGRYVVLRELGVGGMGRVQLAFDTHLGRTVALKGLYRLDPETVARFQREARLAAKLDHAGIVSVHDVGEWEGQPYITMQVMDGGSLAGAKVEGDEGIRLFRDVARAVGHAHAQGVLHRDLKPGNLLRDRAGTVRVSDFGLAKEWNVEGATTLGTTGIVGTPEYMSPEQAQGRNDRVGPTSDVFSLGSTFYKVLTGVSPFLRKDLYATLEAVVKEDPPRSGSIHPKVPREVETILLKCLAKEPGRRYRDATELADDLDRFLSGEPIRSRRASLTYRLRRRVKRNPWAWGVGAAAAVLAVAAGGGVGIQYERSRRLGERGLALAQEGQFEEAREALEHSVALWDHAKYRDELATVRRELAARRETLERTVGAARLGAKFEELYERLSRDLTRAEEARFGGPALTESEERELRGRVDAELDALGSPWDQTSLPAAFRGWVLCNLGLEEEGERELQSAVERGGIERGDPYGLVLRAWWRGNHAAGMFQVRLAWGGKGPVEVESPEISPEIRGELARLGEGLAGIAEWPGWSEVREGRHYGRFIGGLAALASGDLGAAAPSLESLGSSPLLAPSSFLFAGMAWFLGGRHDEAARCFEEALRLRPRWGFVALMLGNARMALGEAARGQDFDQALAWMDQAISAYSQFLALRPDDAVGLVNRANAYMRKGIAEEAAGRDAWESFERARIDYAEAMRLDPGMGDTRYDMAVLHLNLGKATARRGNDPRPHLREAITWIDRLVASGGGFLDAYLLRGNARQGLGDAEAAQGGDPRDAYREAISDYEAAEALDPLEPDVYNNLGNACSRLGTAEAAMGIDPRPRLERAIQEYTRAIEHDESHVSAYGNRGFTRVRFAQAEAARGIDPRPTFREAIRDLEHSLSLDPSSVEFHSNLGSAWVLLAEVESFRGDDPTESLRRALAGFDEALARNPESLEALHGRGTAHTNMAEALGLAGEDPREEYRRAISDFDRALARNPEYAVAYVSRAAARVSLGEDEGRRGGDPHDLFLAAVADVREALARNPESLEAYNGLGIALRRLGDAEQGRGEDPCDSLLAAVEAFDQALARNPSLWQALANKGQALESLSRFAEAAEAYEAALQIVGDGFPQLREWRDRARARSEEF